MSSLPSTVWDLRINQTVLAPGRLEEEGTLFFFLSHIIQTGAMLLTHAEGTVGSSRTAPGNLFKGTD